MGRLGPELYFWFSPPTSTSRGRSPRCGKLKNSIRFLKPSSIMKYEVFNILDLAFNNDKPKDWYFVLD